MPVGESTTSKSGRSRTASEFRAKIARMKSWKPAATPSNRDRLELFALHKQAVSSDAPTFTPTKPMSPAEKAKLASWRTKRGLSQQQAMTAYILEADRQLLVYGTAPPCTPTNTPAAADKDDGTSSYAAYSTGSATAGSVLLTPRGLAAIPLLCAAASESRTSYLARLSSTIDLDSGWWSRQEPLCSEPGSIFALPEVIVLTLAVLIERASLHIQLDSGVNSILSSLGLRPGVLQSLLWPMHNVLLVVWMLVIFLSTLTGSAVITFKTMLLGSKRTGVTLESAFSQEIRPCKHGAGSLCESHQTASVRLLGLALYPLGFICNFSDGIAERVPMSAKAQLFVGSGVYIISGLMLWWYWFFLLPWMAMAGIVLSFSVGWCFSLIELAGM